MIRNLKLWLSMQNIDADDVLEAIAGISAIVSIATHLTGFSLISNITCAMAMITTTLWLTK